MQVNQSLKNRVRSAGFALVLAFGIGSSHLGNAGKPIRQFADLTADSALSQKLSPALSRLYDQGASAPILLLLKDQVDLRSPYLTARVSSAPNRATRIRAVYDALRTKALTTQSGLIAELRARGLSYQRFYIVNAIAVSDVDLETLQALASRSDVERVVGDPVMLGVEPRDPSVEPVLPRSPRTGVWDSRASSTIAPNLEQAGVRTVWEQYKVKGEGIVVAGQDSGYDWNHPALKSQYRGSRGLPISHNFHWHDAIKTPLKNGSTNSCGYALSAPCDDNGHGTHTMGTMVGDDGQLNAIGMAPESLWMGCRNMDSGYGRPTTYLECFEYFLAPYARGSNPMVDGQPSMAPHVINNSWGCPTSEGCDGSEFTEALDALKKAGIAVVISAGNDGPGCASIGDAPAHHTGFSLRVGAHDHSSLQLAYFSSRGPSRRDGGMGPEVTAPGERVRSSLPNNRYGANSGTSMAGPHVAGLVALIWSAQPKLEGKVDETFELIRQTAKPMRAPSACGGEAPGAIPNNSWGHGMIDATAAVARAIKLTPSLR